MFFDRTNSRKCWKNGWNGHCGGWQSGLLCLFAGSRTRGKRLQNAFGAVEEVTRPDQTQISGPIGHKEEHIHPVSGLTFAVCGMVTKGMKKLRQDCQNSWASTSLSQASWTRRRSSQSHISVLEYCSIEPRYSLNESPVAVSTTLAGYKSQYQTWYPREC